MPDYSNSKVYKLVNSIDSKIYVGSTSQPLCKRLAKHKSDAKHKPQFVHKHFNTIGWDTVRIILIESVECFNKEQLVQREQHHIDLYKPELNKVSAYTNCPHNRRHNRCLDCRGAGICLHNRRKTQCNICCGVSMCCHNKQKQQCKQCHGTQICEHNRKKASCKICSSFSCIYCDMNMGKSEDKRHTLTKKHINNFINY